MSRLSSLGTVIFAVALLGAGCADRFKHPAGQSKQPTAVEQAFGSATSTLGSPSSTAAVTSAASDALPAKQWDRTSIPWRHVGFTSPAGYWTYLLERSSTFSLVPGNAPTVGSPDPQIDVYTKRVAEFYAVEYDKISFPTWGRFEITMAQFACASGDTDDAFVACTDKQTNVFRGATQSGLPYAKFTLPAYRKKDKAFVGSHTYFVVRLGSDSEHAVLVSVLNETAGSAPAWSLVKSMKLE